MQSLLLVREPSTDEGTFGVLTGFDFSYESLELPWRDNQHGISCIPEGKYSLKWFESPKHGWCYLLENVPDRSMIEIHSANFAGDESKGWDKQLDGCIALGKHAGVMPNSKRAAQHCITQSKLAIAEFHVAMGEEPATIEIQWRVKP